MDIFRLGNLQLALFLMIIIGMLLTKKRVISDEGKRCLTDICVDVIIPCNILKSCLIPFKGNLWETFSHIFLAGLILQIIFMILNQFLFQRYSPDRQKVLKYGTLVCNSGFLGYPVAEGIYGPLGLFYASIFLIPLRIVMWSVGTSYFIAQNATKKELAKKVLTHPCIIALLKLRI